MIGGEAPGDLVTVGGASNGSGKACRPLPEMPRPIRYRGVKVSRFGLGCIHFTIQALVPSSHPSFDLEYRTS